MPMPQTSVLKGKHPLQIANTQARTEITSTPRHKKGLFSFLPCKSGPHKSLVETLPGQRWVQLNDRLGARSAMT